MSIIGKRQLSAMRARQVCLRLHLAPWPAAGFSELLERSMPKGHSATAYRTFQYERGFPKAAISDAIDFGCSRGR